MKKQKHKINYTEQKQKVYQEFNSTILNFINRNGGLFSPWSHTLIKDSALDFDLSVKNGKVVSLGIQESGFPLAFIQELTIGGITRLYFVRLNEMTVIDGMTYYSNPIPITSEISSSLNSFYKSFLRLPKKCAIMGISNFSVSVNYASLSYYFYTQGDLVSYTSLDDWSSM